MTREEAIKVLRTESVEIGGNAVSVCRFFEAVDMAVTALLEQDEAKSELRKYHESYEAMARDLTKRTEQVRHLQNAISALRQQEPVTNRNGLNEPLTLDELRKMDGEPVWCEIYIKGQPSFYGIVHGETVTGFISGDDKPANLAITNVGAYGLAWLAYRQKPEEWTV